MFEIRYIYDFDHNPVNEYTIKKGKYQISVLNLGATITKLVVPNRNDKYENIHLRYHDYSLYKEPSHQLGKVLSNLEPLNVYFKCEFDHESMIFTYDHNNQFYQITYTLKEDTLEITYKNNQGKQLSNHIALNLSGNLKDNIYEQELMINDKAYYPNDLKFPTTTNQDGMRCLYVQNGIDVCFLDYDWMKIALDLTDQIPLLLNKGKQVSKGYCYRFNYQVKNGAKIRLKFTKK